MLTVDRKVLLANCMTMAGVMSPSILGHRVSSLPPFWHRQQRQQQFQVLGVAVHPFSRLTYVLYRLKQPPPVFTFEVLDSAIYFDASSLCTGCSDNAKQHYFTFLVASSVLLTSTFHILRSHPSQQIFRLDKHYLMGQKTPDHQQRRYLALQLRKCQSFVELEIPVLPQSLFLERHLLEKVEIFPVWWLQLVLLRRTRAPLCWKAGRLHGSRRLLKENTSYGTKKKTSGVTIL